MIVNVGRVIKRPREWDGRIRISNIPVGTKCFPEVFGQTAAVVHHSTKLFHLQREQAVSQPHKEPLPGVSLLFLLLWQYFTSLWFFSLLPARTWMFPQIFEHAAAEVTWDKDLQSMFALPIYTCFMSTIQNLLCNTPPVKRPKSIFFTWAPEERMGGEKRV